jgi:hypothetical protein
MKDVANLTCVLIPKLYSVIKSYPLGVHLLQCVHGSEHTRMHDFDSNLFASIVKEVNFHVLYEQLYTLFSLSLQTYRWCVDINISKDRIYNVRDIVDLTHVDLLSQAIFTLDFAISKATRMKEWSS